MLLDLTHEPAGSPQSVTLEALLHAADDYVPRLQAVAGAAAAQQPQQCPVVAIMAEQGAELMLCQLIAQRAGCAFLLVDPSLPQDRVRYLLNDSGAMAMLLVAPHEPALPESLPIIHVQCRASSAVQLTSPSGCADVARALLAPSARGTLMYVCYTSGSTGRPKGVAVSQGSLVAYAEANAVAHAIGPSSRVLLTSAVSFDPCIGEAWTALLAGATLCLPSRTSVRESLGALLASSAATHVCSTPALWTTVGGSPAAFPHLEVVTLGGERMSAALIARWASELDEAHRSSSELIGAHRSSSDDLIGAHRSSSDDLIGAHRSSSDDLIGAHRSSSDDLIGAHRMALELDEAHGPPTRRRRRLCNIYGVTECTVYQSSYEVTAPRRTSAVTSVATAPIVADDGQGALLGAPLPGCTLLLLDDALRVIEPPAMGSGVEASNAREAAGSIACTGQIAIGGPQLAQGYLNQSALTAERFVEHPTLGYRVYLTGDVAAWACTPDGAASLRLLGRRDQQVKLNGMRLELGEVEGLPAAVTPSEIVLVIKMPLTPTGKLDRIALAPMLRAHLAGIEGAPSDTTSTGRRIDKTDDARLGAAPDTARLGAAPGVARAGAPPPPPPPQPLTAPALNPLEAAIAAVWADVLKLGLERLGRRSDFVRLGGDSIRALQVARKLAFTLVSTHAPRAPSSRRNDEEDVDTADYGLLRGVWSPKAVLQLPLLYRYAAFLAEHGVCVPGDEAAASEAASPTAALAPAAHEADVEARGKAAPAHKAPEPDHSAAAAILDAAEAAAACEAAAAEEEELIDEIMRLSSELTNPTLTRPTLQLSLSLAARYGNDVLARTALALGADCAPRASRALRGDTILNERGLPPLHLAVQAGHTALVHTLLGASAPVTLISTAGLPPLHLAAQSDVSRGALELLLDAGAPIAMRDDRRQTALHSAARAGCLGALRRLIEAGVEYDGREERTSNRREPTIELRDRWHRTALHWAVVNQQHAAAALLISAGASVNGVPMSARKHGKNTSLPLETPLHSAARLPPNAAAPLVQLLLAAAADPNRRDQFGQTPLHVAAAASAQAPCGRCASGSDAIGQGADAAVVALLEAGAAAATKDDMDRSALDAARLSHTAAGRDELPLEISRLLT
eukprot:jgi/Chrpa1/23736/Chrysochromulina_OHIO_Genome00000660-RA